jgi:hypothetical protein
MRWEPKKRVGHRRCQTVAGLALSASLLVVLTACTQAPTQAGPTVGAAATVVATAVQPAVAAASPIAGQAAAAASPVVATAVAAASPIATQAAAAASPAVATAAAANPVRITGAQLGASDATITVQNVSGSTINLAGWRLSVGSASASLPEGATIAPNEMVTIHTASGANTARDIFLGQAGSSLTSGLRPGATIALANPAGARVAEYTLPG